MSTTPTTFTPVLTLSERMAARADAEDAKGKALCKDNFYPEGRERRWAAAVIRDVLAEAGFIVVEPETTGPLLNVSPPSKFTVLAREVDAHNVRMRAQRDWHRMQAGKAESNYEQEKHAAIAEAIQALIANAPRK